MRAGLLLCLLLLSCGPAREFRFQQGPDTRPVTVLLGASVVPGGIRFVYLPDVAAHSVSVAGSFNGWHPAEFFLTKGDGLPVWSGFLPLTNLGRVHFCYFINGHLRRADPILGSDRDEDGQPYSSIVIQAPTNG